MKFILFEGPDKTGKTTAINQLCSLINLGETEEFGNKYHAVVLNKPYSCPGDDRLQFKRNFIDASLHMMYGSMHALEDDTPVDNVVVFIDRCHISEYVYSELFNRSLSIWLSVLDLFFMTHDTMLVQCVNRNVNDTIRKFEYDGTIDGLSFMEYKRSIVLFEKYCSASWVNYKIKYSYDRFDDLVGSVSDFLAG